MADAHQFAKVKAIVDSDPSRRVVVVSAAGKRSRDDHKLTDLLYLCYAHLQYGVSCDAVFDMIRSRYLSIRDELHLSTPLEAEFAALREKMDRGISQDELVSRGEYFAARLMADYLGYDFLDSICWLRFRLDGTVDQPASYEALRRTASGRRVVIPGFYGAMPDGSVKTFTRGGSDITGALAAAALDADVYENWTDVSGFLMADPKIVQDPRPIERITYAELRELSYIGAQVLHEGTVSPVREKNIPLNIRNTNQPDHPGTMIRERFDEPELADEIRKKMFVFEDILLLDDRAIQRVLRDVDNNDLALALKGANEQVQTAIFNNMSKRLAVMIKEDMEFMGPVRMKDVEEAQQKIVNIIRKLEDSAEIVISRGGGDEIVV